MLAAKEKPQRLTRTRRDVPIRGTCHLDRRRRSEATEEEWRDPEDVGAALLMQGVLPHNYPGGRVSRLRSENVDAKLGVKSVAPVREVGFRRGGAGTHTTRSLGRTPHIRMAEDAFSGSLHSLSVCRSAGSLEVGRDDRVPKV